MQGRSGDEEDIAADLGGASAKEETDDHRGSGNGFDAKSETKDEQRQEQQKSGKARKHLLQHSAEFVANYTPPDYLIDGLIQRRYVYSLTAPTGDGKTCIALRIAAHAALGLMLGTREVDKVRVLFFAGENPDDVRARWIKLCEEMEIEPENIDVFFLPGSPPISTTEIRRRINEEALAKGPFGLLIVDTSAAYFQGDDENSNAQLGEHARMLRSFINLPGGPTIIVTCHPVKNPDRTNLLPRGGGAFLAEVDGNLVLIKEPGRISVDLHWHGKFRGPDFAPISFKLTAGTSDKLKDTKGRKVWTVTAAPITDVEREAMQAAGRSREDQLMVLMSSQPDLSMRDMATSLGWTYQNGEPNQSLVQRTLKSLTDDKLVEKGRRGTYSLTAKGRRAVEEMANGPM
jgi:DNA-binding PadR family transcriptional regulator